MSGNKVCKKCGKKYLGWDKDFHSKTGKWKLENHKREDGKWCNKPPEKTLIRTASKMVLCKMCDTAGSIGGLCTKENIQEHIERFHSKGEIMTELDYKMMGGLPKTYLKYWKHDPHYMKHYLSLK